MSSKIASVTSTASSGCSSAGSTSLQGVAPCCWHGVLGQAARGSRTEGWGGDSKQAGEPQRQGPTEDLWHCPYLGCSREAAAISAGAAVLLSKKSKSKQCRAHLLGRLRVRASHCSGAVTARTAACGSCPWLHPLAPSPALGAAPPARCAPHSSSQASVRAGSGAVATWLLLTPRAIGALGGRARDMGLACKGHHRVKGQQEVCWAPCVGQCWGLVPEGSVSSHCPVPCPNQQAAWQPRGD